MKALSNSPPPASKIAPMMTGAKNPPKEETAVMIPIVVPMYTTDVNFCGNVLIATNRNIDVYDARYMQITDKYNKSNLNIIKYNMPVKIVLKNTNQFSLPLNTLDNI